ncbi:zinc-binding alcohol dehydrogenase/oxidoreductase [Salinicoccus halodurans]|uniref:Zinc-binding alcohol dehydrogenase/oxidoreductase n=2 Tax=Salinicoccus halodurans TaxID=407035 RepID=A0AA94KWD6_9STAP|nr:zinc-binding alcohol dehydrogenase/oxidoreductase [Salinicoccus halodurans]
MMKAVLHEGASGRKGLKYGEIDSTEPKEGEVRVRLKTAGLNHRDLFIPDRHKAEDPALVLGSDGAGIVDAVGDGVDSVKKGDAVIINPSLGWEKNSDVPPEGFEIVGLPFHGTFAEYITVPAENAVEKPDFLSWEEAGVLALSAMTAYRALFTRAKVTEGMTVLIPGASGGAGTCLLQFAVAAGAKVYVTSRSEEKRKQALELGAAEAIDSEADWNEALAGEKVDVVIESVGAATFNKSVDQLRRGGTLVAFGASAGDTVEFNLRKFFYGQYNLLGSTMASAEELQEMLGFIEEHEIRPVMDKSFALSDFEEAFDRLENADMMGKIVFNIE